MGYRNVYHSPAFDNPSFGLVLDPPLARRRRPAWAPSFGLIRWPKQQVPIHAEQCSITGERDTALSIVLYSHREN